MKKTFLYIILMVITVSVFGQYTHVVTKTTDPNPFTDPYNFVDSLCDPDMYGTLQWAIRKSNDDNGISVIQFNIPGNGPHEILLNDYLPQITAQVTIDGETQPGYTTGNPAIIVNGQNSVKTGFNAYNARTTISGIHIKNFVNNGIYLSGSTYSRVMNCVITAIVNNETSKVPAIGIKVSSNYVSISGNTIMTREGTSSSLAPTYGVYIDKSYYCTIGVGVNLSDEPNIISECGNAGVAVNTGTYNKICRNSIYGNNNAILLLNGGNGGILPPEITSHESGILSGRGLANNTVEIFGSTGAENAEEYLFSTVVDANGYWSVEAAAEYDYFIATQTNGLNNTSALSNASFNNNGSTCGRAFLITPDNYLYFSDFTIYESEMWFRFTAQADTGGVFILPDTSSQNHITDISLFEAPCDNMTLLGNSDYADSLSVWTNNMAANHEYLIRVNNQNADSVEFTLGIYFKLDVASFECPVVCPDLIHNGDFEVLSSSVHPDYPFHYSQGDVCGWRTAFGSPQIKSTYPYDPLAPHYAFMWAQTNTSGSYGEGICQNVDICKGETYQISFRYKALAGSIYPINFDIRVLFTESNTFNYAETEDGADLPDFDDFNNDLFQIAGNQTLATTGLPSDTSTAWIYKHYVFTADRNYSRLLIYPFNVDEGTYLHFRIDKISLLRLETDAGEDQSICVGESTQLDPADCHPHYTWASSPSGFSSDLMTPTVSPVTTTDYYLIITDDNGCTANDTVTVYVYPQPDATINPVSPICVNANSIYLSAASMGSGSYWSGNGIVDHLSGLFDPSVAGAGTHTISYFIDNGACADSATINIEVLPLPDITASNDGPACEGETVHFTGSSTSGIAEYQWFGPGGTLGSNQNFTLSSAQLSDAGEYMVTVTDVNGCTNEAETTLEVYQNPTVTITPENPVICNNTPVTLTANGGVSYVWNTGAVTQSINVSQGNTTFSVVATDIHGCTGQSSVYVNESNIVITNLNISNACGNDNNGSISVSASGGAIPYAYAWTGPGTLSANTPLISNLYPGTYNLTVSDDNLCSVTASYIVEAMESPELAITGDTVCVGENTGSLSVSVTNMTDVFTYDWSGGQHTSTVSGLSAGSYTVTVTASNSCSNSISSQVSNYPVPVVNITPADPVVCNQEPIILDAGFGWVSYHWNAGETTQQIVTINHDTDFSVTVTDNNGCEGYASIHTTGSNMGIKDTLIVNTCEGSNNGSISIVVAGGDAPVSYSWVGPGTFTATTEDISNLFAGIYSVTITDANECEITAQFEVLAGEIPQLTATGSHVCNGAATGEAGVTINNPSGTYTYLWSNAATTPEITNQLPGDYYVTVTDQSGCSAVAEAIIEDYTVNAEFSFNSDCLDLDRISIAWYYNLHFDFEYNAIDWQNYDFYWDLGNGTTSTDLTVPVDYTMDGYYCVSAVVSREECVSTSSDVVYVYPHRCYCEGEQGETVFDDGFYDDYTISSSGEEWIGETKKIRKQVIVPSGATLYIHKCVLHFGTTGGITVEPGGNLIVSQTEMTSTESGPGCNDMWQGIEVHGQWGLSLEQQGNVRFINGENIIKNAHIGVLLGKRNLDYVCDPHINPELGPFDISGSCGWIKAEDVDFVNNGTDIRFVKPVLNYTYQNPSAVINCDFTCTTLLDACYLSTHPSHYGNSVSTTGTAIIANTRNPWAGGSNPDQRSPQSIWMQKQKFATSFDKDTVVNKQNCVESYDSRYNIYRSSFDSAAYGIRIFNTLSTANNSHRIYQNTFDKIPFTTSTTGAGIFITGGILDRIRDNQFGFIYSIQDLSNTGVQIAGASRFVVEENEFYNLKNGVLAGNTGNQSSDIRAGTSDLHDNWRGNNFQRCKTNIYTRGNNPRLRLRCNNCENDAPLLYYVNFQNQGVLANQGIYLSAAIQPTWGAGNEFFDDEDFPSDQSKYIKSDYTYGYVYHSNPKTIPVVYPGTTLNLQALNIPKGDNSIACVTLELPFPFPFTNGIPAIGDIIPIRSDILNNIDSLKQVYSDIKDIEDGGFTLELLADISNQINDTVLRDELIANSPLSDTVITSLLIEYPLLHSSFISVMLLNMPVSKAVEPYLFARMETLPQEVSQLLIPLQSYNPVINTATSVTRVIDYLTQERELLVNEVLMIFTDSAYYNSDYVKQILAAENNPEFDKNLAAVLIDEGDYTGAQQIIDSIVPVDKETSDWIDYHEILLSLYQDNKTIYQMDSLQLAFVTEMAYKCPEDYTTANAQAVLHLLYGTEFEDCVEMASRRSFSLVKDVVFKEPENKAWFTDNFPDPFSDETSVNYYLPYGSTGSIVVNDMYGRVTAVFDLPAGENTLVIKSDRLAPGVYSYGFIVDGKSMGHKKMIITK